MAGLAGAGLREGIREGPGSRDQRNSALRGRLTSDRNPTQIVTSGHETVRVYRKITKSIHFVLFSNVFCGAPNIFEGGLQHPLEWLPQQSMFPFPFPFPLIFAETAVKNDILLLVCLSSSS